MELRNEALEIAVPNDFIGEWIGRNFARPIADAVHEVLGCTMAVRFMVVPERFDVAADADGVPPADAVESAVAARPTAKLVAPDRCPPTRPAGKPMVRPPAATAGQRGVPVVSPADAVHMAFAARPRLRHDLSTFVVGPSSQLAFNTVNYVSEFPGSQYNPLFVHGNCGLGKTHLLQGLCKRFAEHHPTKRWQYMTGEEFTNEFLVALRANKLDALPPPHAGPGPARDRRRPLPGRQEGDPGGVPPHVQRHRGRRQAGRAGQRQPPEADRGVRRVAGEPVRVGMVVRVDPPNVATRCEILRALAVRQG